MKQIQLIQPYRIKALTLLLLIVIEVSASGKNECNALKPIPWETIQNQEHLFSQLKPTDAFSSDCPIEIDDHEKLEKIGTKYSQIFFSDYYWTEYRKPDKKICVVKHSQPGLFDSEFEPLSMEQSEKLLFLDKQFGFNQDSKKVINLHRLLQRQAIKEKEKGTLKYGGIQNMFRLMEFYPPETDSNTSKATLEISGYFAEAQHNRFIQNFESKYSKETLNKFIEDVKENPPNRLFNGKYPFCHAIDLILEAKNDIESSPTSSTTHY